MTAFKGTIQALVIHNLSLITHTTHLIFLITVFSSTRAQLPENVAGLVAADRAAAALCDTEGPRRALLSIVDKASVLYVPAAVNALNYLDNRPNLPALMAWRPNFALVSKSRDFGVTAGPMSFRKKGFPRRYGHYLSVWHRDKGRWKIRLRA